MQYIIATNHTGWVSVANPIEKACMVVNACNNLFLVVTKDCCSMLSCFFSTSNYSIIAKASRVKYHIRVNANKSVNKSATDNAVFFALQLNCMLHFSERKTHRIECQLSSAGLSVAFWSLFFVFRISCPFCFMRWKMHYNASFLLKLNPNSNENIE